MILLFTLTEEILVCYNSNVMCITNVLMTFLNGECLPLLSSLIATPLPFKVFKVSLIREYLYFPSAELFFYNLSLDNIWKCFKRFLFFFNLPFHFPFTGFLLSSDLKKIIFMP